MWAFRRASRLRPLSLEATSIRFPAFQVYRKRQLLHLRSLGDVTVVLELLLLCPCAVVASLPKGEKNAVEEDESEDDGDHSVSESDLSEDEEIGKTSYDDLCLTEHEADSARKKQLKKAVSKLSKALTAAQGSSVQHVIAKWIEEGKELGEKEIFMVMLPLRKRKMYLRALRMSFSCTIFLGFNLLILR